MTKQEFLAAIRARTAGLRPEDRERSLDYYAEMIDDRMEENLSEEEAVEAMGSVEDAVAQILSENPLPGKEIPQPPPRKERHAGVILLLILGAPLWLTLVLAAAIILLSLYIVIWSVVISLYAAMISLAAGALGGILGGFILLLTGQFVQAVLFFGESLFCTGAAILSFFGVNQVARGVIWLCKQPFVWGKKYHGRGHIQ